MARSAVALLRGALAGEAVVVANNAVEVRGDEPGADSHGLVQYERKTFES
jgi:hypothetical protein